MQNSTLTATRGKSEPTISSACPRYSRYMLIDSRDLSEGKLLYGLSSDVAAKSIIEVQGSAITYYNPLATDGMDAFSALMALGAKKRITEEDILVFADNFGLPEHSSAGYPVTELAFHARIAYMTYQLKEAMDKHSDERRKKDSVAIALKNHLELFDSTIYHLENLLFGDVKRVENLYSASTQNSSFKTIRTGTLDQWVMEEERQHIYPRISLNDADANLREHIRITPFGVIPEISLPYSEELRRLINDIASQKEELSRELRDISLNNTSEQADYRRRYKILTDYLYAIAYEDWEDDNNEQPLVGLQEARSAFIAHLELLSPPMLRHIGLYIIKEVINHYLEHTGNSGLVVYCAFENEHTDDVKISLKYGSNNFLQAVWLQFLFAIEGRMLENGRVCRECGRKLSPSRKDQIFCSNTTCRQVYYNRIKRQVRRMHDNGWDDNRIASHLNISVEWVRKYVPKA